MQRPNILYIHSHDTGRYVQPYGYAVPTPRIQQLAEEGVVFRRAFCAAPTCSPSRAALLTGQYPHQSGMLGLAHRGFGLSDVRQHLSYVLRDAGYHTALAGIQHEARDPATLGYDEIIEHDGHAERVAPAVEEWLAHAQQPFFLSAGFFETHRPFPISDPPSDARYMLPPASLPDTPETRQDFANYCESARMLDRGIGRILDTLEGAGLADSTLVICTTDHGIAFPGMKCSLTDRGTGVMLIVRGPGGFEGGRVSEAMVGHIDIVPTLCDLLGLPRPAWLQGESLLPLLDGTVPEVHDALFSEVTYHAAYEPQRAMRTQRWKYIRRWGDRVRPVLPNCDNGPSKDVWLRHGWAEQEIAAEQLYDLVFDPAEQHNLASDSAYADILHTMRGQLERWMHDTADPLLDGFVAAPPGAVVDDANALAPS